MKKYPKYIVLPSALLIYFIVMGVYGITRNDGQLPPQFWTIAGVELVIIVGLFFALRYLHHRRQ